ncbi:hypothetical protein K435DRAFT_971601 [Dendrothele bispora CBS 962.96]|uniref:Uncharacterized protein n=1 Tax=Dendrothele bispora (strain CBS 962.96) TaxID=1314807 RepID=A0A4S8L4T6_DENBC|nr:hypothetical protein K435DRAFT_971601 [Dendrothele bispora CBS 962.96]
MPEERDTECPCTRCSKKSRVQRTISKSLARKHVQHYSVKMHESQPETSRPIPQNQQETEFGTADMDLQIEAEIDEMEFNNPRAAGAMDHAQEQDQPRINPLTQYAPPSDTTYTPISIPGPLYPPLQDNLNDTRVLAPVFRDGDPSFLHIIYLGAVFNNIYAKASVRQTETNLGIALNSLDAAGAILSEHPTPVQTLASAKRRLGLDPDDHIIQYACTVPGCTGIIYTEKREANGSQKRHAIKIIPHVSLIQSLRHIVRRKGFRRLIRDSREDNANRNNDEDFLMTDMHDGNLWYGLKTGIQREVSEFGTVRDSPLTPESERKLNEHRFGLHLVVNLDWFGAISSQPHSAGPMYVSIADLPRHHRFLQRNVICLMITPGPLEPTTEQLNHCTEPPVRELCALKEGIKMEMYDENDEDIVEEEVYSDFICNSCDTPGARKLAGFAGHGADMHPCPWCRCTSVDVDKPEGYNINTFIPRNDYDLLKHKFQAKDAPPQRQPEILGRHGVRFSTFDWIPGWHPCRQTALDFMHCIFLGSVVAWLWTQILFASHMFYGAGPTSPRRQFEDAINAIRWPSHITRLPKNLGENQSLKKADEWRRLLTVTPVVLWMSWRDEQDKIPDTEPSLAPNETIKTKHSRKRKSLYNVILMLCAGVRLLSTKTISMHQANAGVVYLSNYCHGLLLLGASLSINHHIAMHFASMIKLYGPVYAWWLFAFEHFNSMLEKVKLNGHDGGRMELTMMRHWVMTHLVYEYLLELPADASPHELKLVDRIINAEVENNRGAMMTEIAIFRSEATSDSISLPKRISKKPFNIHSVFYEPTNVNLYLLLYNFYQSFWPDLNLQSEFSAQPGLPFIGTDVARRLPYVRKDGYRYGCKSNRRTQADTMAFADLDGARVPIQIEDLFIVTIPNSNKPPHICAIIRRLFSDESIPAMPWDTFSSVLGIYVSYAHRYQAFEVVAAKSIDCPLAVVEVEHHRTRQNLWITISFDHTGAEPQEDFEEDDNVVT